MRWFIPTRGGDVRLEKSTESSCYLSVLSPTQEEVQILSRFEVEAVSRDWLPQGQRLEPRTQGELRVLIQAPLTEVGPVLVEAAFHGDGVWTAVRSETGVKLVDGTPSVPAETRAAASLRPPARGCPAPIPTNRRASEVLRTFSTRAQVAEWERTGSLVAFGSLTGQPYRIFHRNEAVRRGLGHILVDAAGREVCVWDCRVPAEEEVLGAKLAVEHCEAWLRG